MQVSPRTGNEENESEDCCHVGSMEGRVHIASRIHYAVCDCGTQVAQLKHWTPVRVQGADDWRETGRLRLVTDLIMRMARWDSSAGSQLTGSAKIGANE